MNKLIIALLLVFIAISTSMFVQNMKLNKKIEELVQERDKLKAEAAKHMQQEKKAINPDEVSPFDRPNNDPVADRYAAEGKSPVTTIKFNKLVHDFGRVNAGEKVKTKFTFTNTGEYGLIIYSAQSTCGCTVPDWPKLPIKPGQADEIWVEFDSEGKSGEISKVVTVTANTEPRLLSLTIKATVIPADK